MAELGARARTVDVTDRLAAIRNDRARAALVWLRGYPMPPPSTVMDLTKGGEVRRQGEIGAR